MHFLRAMDPTVFGFVFSLNLVIAVIVGGLMSIWGGAVGALVGITIAVPMLLKRVLGNSRPTSDRGRVYVHRLLYDRDPTGA